jgi:hypothetical protein
MMNGMPKDPQAADAPAPQGDQPQGSGGAAQIVSGIHTQLMALMDMLDKSPSIGDESKQALGEIIAQYQSFVKNDLGSAPGQKPPAAPQPAVSSPEAGANPNARPM